MRNTKLDETGGEAAIIFSFLFPVIVLFLILGIFLSLITTVSRPPSPTDYSHGPVHLETNSLGCNKYDYKDSVYWSCPPELKINSIEETRLKQSPEQIPVVPEVSP